MPRSSSACVSRVKKSSLWLAALVGCAPTPSKPSEPPAPSIRHLIAVSGGEAVTADGIYVAGKRTTQFSRAVTAACRSVNHWRFATRGGDTAQGQISLRSQRGWIRGTIDGAFVINRIRCVGTTTVVAGAFSGALRLGGHVVVADGATDAFVAFIDGDTVKWVRRFGGAWTDFALGVGVSTETIAVAIGGIGRMYDGVQRFGPARPRPTTLIIGLDYGGRSRWHRRIDRAHATLPLDLDALSFGFVVGVEIGDSQRRSSLLQAYDHDGTPLWQFANTPGAFVRIAAPPALALFHGQDAAWLVPLRATGPLAPCRVNTSIRPLAVDSGRLWGDAGQGHVSSVVTPACGQ